MARHRPEHFVANALAHTPVGERAALLIQMIEHSAKGLAVIKGRSAAVEAVYRMADELVGEQSK